MTETPPSSLDKAWLFSAIVSFFRPRVVNRSRTVDLQIWQKCQARSCQRQALSALNLSEYWPSRYFSEIYPGIGGGHIHNDLKVPWSRWKHKTKLCKILHVSFFLAFSCTYTFFCSHCTSSPPQPQLGLEFSSYTVEIAYG